MRKINFGDGLEKMVAGALNDAGIEFIHESESKDLKLDFYLPSFDVYIEVKRFHADRIERQMSSKDNVIAIQGIKSVEFIIKYILNQQLAI